MINLLIQFYFSPIICLVRVPSTTPKKTFPNRFHLPFNSHKHTLCSIETMKKNLRNLKEVISTISRQMSNRKSPRWCI